MSSTLLLTPKSTAEYVVQRLEDPVILTDEDGLIVSANDAGGHFLGMGEVTGRRISEILGAAPNGDVQVHDEKLLSFRHTRLYRRSGGALGQSTSDEM